MKKFINKLIILSLIALSASCSVDDVEPYYQLTPEDAIRDEASAQRILNGVYDLSREFDVSFFPLHLAAYGNEGRISGFLSGMNGMNNNTVKVQNPFLSNLYNGHYKIINSANFLIGKLEEGAAVGISDERKASMIAEAKTMRALVSFKLLRYFGEHYDLSSPYGIVLKTNFSTEIVSIPRSTVQESYDFILEDLDDAIANGPSNIPHFLVGKVTAQALKAKVLLYMNDYQGAASLADEVINNAEGYALETDYASIFTNTYNSPEVLFAPVHGSGSEGGTQVSQVKQTTYSETLRALSDAQVPGAGVVSSGADYDPRFAYAYSDMTKGNNANGKYPFISNAENENNTMYHLRLAEIYLIRAEALLRDPSGDDTEALSLLNEIRTRAGVAPSTTTDNAELLEEVRQEKLLELFFENGEPLFDLVRFSILGDINAADVKQSLDQEYKYIFPMPDQAVIGNTNLEQNPGY
ncbi:MAG: RagB/SusD family nutrient uptake outer membrane protein [Psychroflexus sp.]